jgi:dienelactone hydrolase
MRSLCWYSVALALAACGGGRSTSSDPYAYARSPLGVRDGGIVLSGPRTAVHAVSFLSLGVRVQGFLLVPRAAGRHAAVLFLHGSGGTREDLLVPAAVLANRGFVTMTISQPNDAATYRPLVVNARRALDLLVARRDVEHRRLGVIGFSLGAQTAAILAGDEPRLKAVGIVAGRGTDVARYWVHRAHAKLFFAAGTHDEIVPHAQLVALERAAPDHPLVRWYATGHGMSSRAFADETNWVARALR